MATPDDPFSRDTILQAQQAAQTPDVTTSPNPAMPQPGGFLNWATSPMIPPPQPAAKPLTPEQWQAAHAPGARANAPGLAPPGRIWPPPPAARALTPEQWDAQHRGPGGSRTPSAADEHPERGVKNPFDRQALTAAGATGPHGEDLAALRLGYGPKWRAAHDEANLQEGIGQGIHQDAYRQAYEGAQSMAATQQGLADAQRAHADQEAAKQAAQKSRLEVANEEYQGFVDDAAKDKLDPDRIWHGPAGIARHIASALGVALGAFGAGLTHTPNAALSIVEKAVNDDIEAQKAAHANKKDRASESLGAYNMLRQQGLDDSAARAGTHAIAIQSFMDKIKAQAMTTDSETARTNAAAAMPEYMAKKNAYDAEVARAITAQANRPVAAGAGGATAADIAAAEAGFKGSQQDVRALAPDENGDVAGQGFFGRLAHGVAKKTGGIIDFQSPEAKAAYAAKNRLISREVKDSGARVNEESRAELELAAHGNEGTLTLRQQALERLRAKEQAAILKAAKGGKGGGGAMSREAIQAAKDELEE